MIKQKIRANNAAMLAEQMDAQIEKDEQLLASGHRHGQLPALDLYGQFDEEDGRFYVHDIALAGSKTSLCEVCGDFSATLMARLSADLDAAQDKVVQAEKDARAADKGEQQAEDRKHFSTHFSTHY